MRTLQVDARTRARQTTTMTQPLKLPGAGETRDERDVPWHLLLHWFSYTSSSPHTSADSNDSTDSVLSWPSFNQKEENGKTSPSQQTKKTTRKEKASKKRLHALNPSPLQQLIDLDDM